MAYVSDDIVIVEHGDGAMVINKTLGRRWVSNSWYDDDTLKELFDRPMLTPDKKLPKRDTRTIIKKLAQNAAMAYGLDFSTGERNKCIGVQSFFPGFYDGY